MPAEIVESTAIKGVYHAYFKAFGDARGRFAESYRREWFPGGKEMVQGNRSESAAGVLRGLHYHFNQADYWLVLKGRIFVGLHDLRKGSPTYNQSESFVLGEDDDPRVRDHGVYIPPGVAHGFYTLTDCILTYLVEAYYNPKDELGIMWNDPNVKIDWPNKSPILSERDQKNLAVSDIPPHIQPYWRA